MQSTTPGARSDWILFGLLGLFWGSSYLFIKIGVESIPPFTLVAARLAIGALILGVVLRASRVTLPRDRRVYGHLVVMACINIAIPFSLITWGERSIDSALAAILNSTVPLFTIWLAALVFPTEALTVNRLAGVIVGFAGVVIVVGLGTGAEEGLAGLAGEIALIGSSLSYAIGAVYARRFVHGLAPTVPAFFQVAFACLITGTLALTLEAPWTLTPATEGIVAIVWLGVVGSSMTYLIFFRLIRDWGPTRTSLVAYLLPIVGIVLGAIVLGEVIDARMILGTALVIAGVALVNARRGSRRLFARAGAEAPPIAPEAAAVADEAMDPGDVPVEPAVRGPEAEDPTAG